MRIITPIFQRLSITFIGCLSAPAFSSGFALLEQSASGQGRAFAGGAAIAEDATTIFFNPAGLTRFDRSKLTAALHVIYPDADFAVDNATSVFGVSLGDNDGGSISGAALIPNFYYTTSLSDTFKIGLGVFSPFGLATSYNQNSATRYHALHSVLKTVNINPTAALRIHPQWSVGIGLNAQYIKARLTNRLDSGALLGNAAISGNAAFEGDAEVEGDDWSWGWNIGVLFQLNSATRVGLAYRSKISHRLTGDVDFSFPEALGPGALAALNAVFVDANIIAKTDLPEFLSFSVYHALNDRWAVMSDISWTRWNRFNELRIQFDSNAPDAVTNENWHNTFRFAIGAQYQYNPRLTLRVGTAYDQSPLPDSERTPRIPGEDRTTISIGLGYAFCDTLSVDVGYTHLFIDDATLALNDPNVALDPAGTLVGSYTAEADILSVQLNWTFD